MEKKLMWAKICRIFECTVAIALCIAMAAITGKRFDGSGLATFGFISFLLIAIFIACYQLIGVIFEGRLSLISNKKYLALTLIRAALCALFLIWVYAAAKTGLARYISFKEAIFEVYGALSAILCVSAVLLPLPSIILTYKSGKGGEPREKVFDAIYFSACALVILIAALVSA